MGTGSGPAPVNGHYFWDVLVRDGGRLEECRAVFGDDTQDYNAALQAYYQNGPPADCLRKCGLRMWPP